MYHTIGFDYDEVLDIVKRVEQCAAVINEKIGFPPGLGVFDSIRVAMMYLRRNTRRVELAEYFESSQSTISRAISAVTP